MDKIILRKVQLLQKKTLDEVVKICENNDIKYFLMGGTLLGAIRHKGFIPWDDDLDIAMPRDSYDKFIKIAEKELSENYILQNWENDSNYGCCFSKILIKGTTYLEKEGNPKGENGIFIDIMPFDYITSNEKIEKKYNKKLYLLKKLLLCKCGYTLGKTMFKKLLYKMLGVLACFYKKDKIKQSIKYNIEKIGNGETQYIGNVVFPSNSYNFVRFKYPAEWFTGFSKVEFEEGFYNAPKEYLKFLEAVYGDFMTPPSEAERLKGHDVIEVNFQE